jgi:hypothetical protein
MWPWCVTDLTPLWGDEAVDDAADDTADAAAWSRAVTATAIALRKL